MAVDIGKFVKGMGEAQQRIEAATLRALDVAGEQVIGDSQQLAPVKTGALQGSATTLPATIDGTKISKTIGHNTNYAAAVHERLELNHTIGQAKFLETAMRRSAAKVGSFVAGKIADAMK